MSDPDILRPIAAPAHAGWRLLALVYDLLPLAALLMLTSALLLWLHGGRAVEQRSGWALVQLGTFWAIAGGYFVVSWRLGGQTIGMRPWRLQLLAADGNPANWGALWLRYLMASVTPGLCLAWCLLDRERRGLHDLVAGTQLVRRAPPSR